MATVWHGSLIVFQTWLLSTKQVMDYIATRANCPFGTSMQVPDEGVEFQPPSVNPAQTMGLWRTLTRDIWEPNNDQLWEVLEAIQFETARREGHHPCMGHPRPTHGSLGVAVNPAWPTREWALKGGGMVNCQAHAAACQSSMGQCRCQLPLQHTCGWAEARYPSE